MATGVERKSNPVLVELIGQLKTAGRENAAPLWRDIASRLEKPSRNWAQVNVSKLEENVAAGEHAVIPGKLLGDGEVSKAFTVIAFSASASAKAKIAKAGGKVLTFPEGVKSFPKGQNCRIIG
ncbi:MAG: 50S ribosomal protein L18e [Thermoplasmatota archaeon]|nr:50S ribosomal protein L18e [Halobacteriales archaeon]